jgi:competence protein ComEC
MLPNRFLRLLTLVLFILIHARLSAGAPPLVITILDVAHGDAAVIRTPGGRTLLLDGGDGGRGSAGFDAGRDVILPWLRGGGILSLDWLIATHPHNDHIGGLASVLENMPVGRFLDPGMAYPSRQSWRILQLIQEKRIEYLIPQRGERLALEEELALEVLGPPPHLFRHGGSPANDNSLILMLRYRRFSMLFLGDAEVPALQALWDAGFDPACQVIKTSHHGSRTGFHEQLLRQSKAQWALVSTCSNNRFGSRYLGLPHPETLAGYGRLGMAVRRTDLHGSLKVSSDGERFSISSER